MAESWSPVESLLLRLGRELGRDANQMRPIIDHVVHTCWYDSIESLRSIKSEDEWNKLNLPSRLLTLIKRHIDDQQQPPLQEPSAVVGAFDGLSVSGESLEILRRVLTNLRDHPAEAKYRRLNKEKLQSANFLRNENAVGILGVLGFREDVSGTVFVLEGEVNTEIVRKLLEKLPSFNPYAATFTATAGAMTVPHHKAARDRELELATLRQQQQQQSQQPQQGGVRVRTVEESLGPFRPALQTEEEKGGDEELILDAWKKTISMTEERRTFASRQKLELLKKQQVQIASSCSLRVIFPDKTVLELINYFKPSDKIGFVIQTLQQNFLRSQQTVTDFQFSLFLPPRRLTDMNQSCDEAGLVPSATIRFNVDSPKGFPGPFLRDDIKNTI